MSTRRSLRRRSDAAANTQCTPRKNDPLVLGYFIRQRAAVEWAGELAVRAVSRRTRYGDPGEAEGVPGRGRHGGAQEGVCGLASFQKYLETVCGAVRKYDPNHLLLGTRYRPDRWRTSTSLRRGHLRRVQHQCV